MAGTEGASQPFWAPDSRSVGFFADNKLKRLDLGSGAPQALAPAINTRGGTWGADGVILFAPTAGKIFRVPASGGSPVAETTLDRQTAHRFPSFLPDGRHFLFYAAGSPDTAGIYLGALNASAPHRLTPANTGGVYLSSVRGAGSRPDDARNASEGGWLLWAREGALVAQRLDVDRSALTGDPVTLADQVVVDQIFTAASASASGQVAYRTGAGTRRQLTWLDRSGAARGTVGDADSNVLSSLRVSPDGHRVAVYRTVQGNTDLWLLDGVRTSRLTFSPANEQFPVWSPDNSRLAFISSPAGQLGIYQMPTSGAGAEELIVSPGRTMAPSSWSKDGRYLLYRSIDPQTNSDLWVVPMEGEHRPWVFLQTPFNEVRAEFSPDGRWVAYESNESGRMEIYVRPFVPPGPPGTTPSTAAAQWQVSTAGGIAPVWRPDVKELYYLNPAGTMMSAPIAVSGTTFSAGAPVALFPAHIVGGGLDSSANRQYDVAPDGRFLINTVMNEAVAPITLIQHWNPEAKK